MGHESSGHNYLWPRPDGGRVCGYSQILCTYLSSLPGGIERNIGAEAAAWSKELAQEPNRVVLESKAGVQDLEPCRIQQ